MGESILLRGSSENFSAAFLVVIGIVSIGVGIAVPGLRERSCSGAAALAMLGVYNSMALLGTVIRAGVNKVSLQYDSTTLWLLCTR